MLEVPRLELRNRVNEIFTKSRSSEGNRSIMGMMLVDGT